MAVIEPDPVHAPAQRLQRLSLELDLLFLAWDRYDPTTATFVACNPFWPGSVSNSTFAPSSSDLKPDPAIFEKCTNTSSEPSAGVMNPYPFSLLNHFTVPVATNNLLREQTGQNRSARAEHYPLTTHPLMRERKPPTRPSRLSRTT